MASKKQESAPATRPNGEPPSDWRDVEQSIAGYWEESAGPIVGTVVGARSFVNSKNRETTVYMIRLLKPCEARARVDGEGMAEVTLGPGEVCGVFESAGLVSLRTRMNCRVYIKRSGERRTKNGVMKVYTIKSPDKASEPIRVEHYVPSARGKQAEDGAPDIDEVPF